MKIKISATFKGQCTICGKNAVVFSAGDEKSKKVVTICKKCSIRLGNISLDEAIKKFGKKNENAFKNGVKIEKLAG